jgi:hypothetical protein
MKLFISGTEVTEGVTEGFTLSYTEKTHFYNLLAKLREVRF